MSRPALLLALLLPACSSLAEDSRECIVFTDEMCLGAQCDYYLFTECEGGGEEYYIEAEQPHALTGPEIECHESTEQLCNFSWGCQEWEWTICSDLQGNYQMSGYSYED